MTAEILAMNKMAVALAADSAVTVRRNGSQKIFNSANKLFTLSKYHPVGIMVYGNGDLMGIPWEVIIKLFRKKLGMKKFDTLQEYADEFLSFLDKHGAQIPEIEQQRILFGRLLSLYSQIADDIDNRISVIFDNIGETDHKEIQRVVSKTIKDYHVSISKFEDLSYASEEFCNEFSEKNQQVIKEAQKFSFENLPLTKTTIKKLTELSYFVCSKDIISNSNTGMVIAGFGENDLFPSFVSAKIEFVICNRLKYVKEEIESISFGRKAAIQAFAQSDMVSTFMEGINPDYRKLLLTSFGKLLESYPRLLSEALTGTPTEKKRLIQKSLEKVNEELLESLFNNLIQYEKDNHWEPVVGIVSVLPIDDLAAMAESLVNLTSFKRRVSSDDETVGGPVDVAIITKGDGFVWIKRKHYFDINLNHHFMKNYFRAEENERGVNNAKNEGE